MDATFIACVAEVSQSYNYISVSILQIEEIDSKFLCNQIEENEFLKSTHYLRKVPSDVLDLSRF